jgi:hypothetical protein
MYLSIILELWITPYIKLIFNNVSKYWESRNRNRIYGPMYCFFPLSTTWRRQSRSNKSDDFFSTLPVYWKSEVPFTEHAVHYMSFDYR